MRFLDFLSIIIIIIILFWEFFTREFADSFQLEFEWQQSFFMYPGLFSVF